MTASSRLPLLAHRGAYPGGSSSLRRWGQLLRESPHVRAFLRAAEEQELLVPLYRLARLRGGVVTRANAYFIVRELAFNQVPNRFRLTRSDYQRFAVVMDGLETPFKIEREFLRPVIKGPESLLSPEAVDLTDQRVFVVSLDKDSLRANRSNGALEYLRRGETFEYKLSEDTLKGGVPAKRSQIKNRKPYWYSLSVPSVSGPRIVVPEHFDRRYLSTLLDEADESVVIDKLFVVEPLHPEDAELILLSLNSLLGWYQIELRGRTQLGQGVLEIKKADLRGLLVINPAKISKADRRVLVQAFAPLRSTPPRDSLAEIAEPVRISFDETLFRIIGCEIAETARLEVERELRAAIAERAERKASVAEAKLDRRRSSTTAANVDAYAARLASQIEPHPNPASLVRTGTPTWSIPVTGLVDGELTIGTGLFDQGRVYAGDVCIAQAHDMAGAQYLRAVLIADPGATAVEVPMDPALGEVMTEWRALSKSWRQRFDALTADVTSPISDPRLREEVTQRALKLVHAP